jgi:hypothetical protein
MKCSFPEFRKRETNVRTHADNAGKIKAAFELSLKKISDYDVKANSVAELRVATSGEFSPTGKL